MSIQTKNYDLFFSENQEPPVKIESRIPNHDFTVDKMLQQFSQAARKNQKDILSAEFTSNWARLIYSDKKKQIHNCYWTIEESE